MQTTKYAGSIVPASGSMIKEARRNMKIGNRVSLGRLAGAKIWALTLIERETCPTTCKVWDICYGNHMPFAKRHDHRSPKFYSYLSMSLSNIMAPGKPVLIRLHVLGDFFSTEYVDWWRYRLETYSNLNLYGYTAHDPDSTIGRAVHGLALQFGWERAAIRFSGFSGPYRGAVVDADPVPGSFTCPEQEGLVKDCASCGACWDGEKTVRFIPH